MLSSKDVNFVGYTYKNFEIVNDNQLPGIGIIFHPLYMRSCTLCSNFLIVCYNAADLKKKSTKPKRPSIKSLFGKILVIVIFLL